MVSGFEQMRVGDVERESAAAELREHFASGRLTQDELNERLDLTFAARTRADLSALMGDLPQVGSGPHRAFGPAAPPGSGGPFEPASPLGSWPGRRAGRPARLALGGVLTASFFLIPVLVMFGAFGLLGIGSGRPLGIIFIIGAFALLRRLIFGGFRAGRCGPCGPRRRRR